MTVSNTTLSERLREFVKTLRRTPQPINQVVPHLTAAADEIDALEYQKLALKWRVEQMRLVLSANENWLRLNGYYTMADEINTFLASIKEQK